MFSPDESTSAFFGGGGQMNPDRWAVTASTACVAGLLTFLSNSSWTVQRRTSLQRRSVIYKVTGNLISGDVTPPKQ